MEYIAPSIKVINNAIDFSDELIELVTSLPDDAWRSSRIKNDDGTDIEQDDTIRNSREVSVTHSLDRPKLFFELAQIIYNEAKIYSRENGFHFSHMEDVNLLEYSPDEGFFDRHADAGPSYPRSMSALLYLNDVEEGGETWFDKFSLLVKPERAKLVLFPANYPYSHQALPPRSGYKYVVVTWFGEVIERDVFERYYP